MILTNSLGSPESWRTPVKTSAYVLLAFCGGGVGEGEAVEMKESATLGLLAAAGTGAGGSMERTGRRKAVRNSGVPKVSVSAMPRTPSPKQPTQRRSASSVARR